MKISNNIACTLNLIEFKYIDSINLNLKIGLKLNWIEFKFNWIEMGSKLVEKVLKTYSWIWCWKNKLNPKKHLSMPLYWGMGKIDSRLKLVGRMKYYETLSRLLFELD